MDVKWVMHKGKRVIYADYRGARGDAEMLKLLRKESEMLNNINGVLELCNFEDSFVNSKFMDEVKKLGKEQTDKFKKTAILGVTGIKKVLLDGYLAVTGQNNIKTFSEEKSAMDWLAS